MYRLSVNVIRIFHMFAILIFVFEEGSNNLQYRFSLRIYGSPQQCQQRAVVLLKETSLMFGTTLETGNI